MQQQIVTLSLFRFSGAANRWWALGMMGKSTRLFRDIPGMSFFKMLGSGGGSGFAIYPNFGVYACLAVWENEAAATKAFAEHPDWQVLYDRAEQQWTLYLHTLQAHGNWDGSNPFAINRDIAYEGQLMGVLTRATIRPSRLLRFWRSVPNSSQMILRQPGHLFSIGIGELPLIQQATFSLWTNLEAIKRYAYQEGPHKKVVQQTRHYDWYSEELFARFLPYRTTGSWDTGLDAVLAGLH
jgi:hypothetical protein